MKDLIFKDECFQIIGKCMSVHRTLGQGFSEIVYKDALVIEFEKAKMPFSREKEFYINYKGIILPHQYFADFVVMDKIILEIKSVSEIRSDFYAQTINYLKVSGLKLGLIVNFGEATLQYRRVVL